MRALTISLILLLTAGVLFVAEPSPGASADGAADGFVSLFDGKTLDGWQGTLDGHAAENGVLVCKAGAHGKLYTKKEYANFVLRLEYKLGPGGNNGIGLRAPLTGEPAYEGMEVQILDDEAPKYKNLKPEQFCGSVYGAAAAKRGHTKPAGQWNAMEIKAQGSRVTVTLNGAVVTDVDLSTVGPKEIHGRKLANLLRPKGFIALCSHGDRVEFRNPRIKELPERETEEGFISLFDGKTLSGWQKAKNGYVVENGVLVCQKGRGGRLMTAKEYADFVFRFEFKLEPGGNNGVGIRTPLAGNPAYLGMEIQILDDSAPKYKTLQPYQYHGSIYGVVPSKRGHQKPVGQWNTEEIRAEGGRIRVTLNGTVIVDADLDKIEKTMDGRAHPGLHNKKGYVGFLGHGDRIEFRNIRIKEL